MSPNCLSLSWMMKWLLQMPSASPQEHWPHWMKRLLQMPSASPQEHWPHWVRCPRHPRGCVSSVEGAALEVHPP
eukprot:8972092-Lingulodinium_polyedra.AAC.1